MPKDETPEIISKEAFIDSLINDRDPDAVKFRSYLEQDLDTASRFTVLQAMAKLGEDKVDPIHALMYIFLTGVAYERMARERLSAEFLADLENLEET